MGRLIRNLDVLQVIKNYFISCAEQNEYCVDITEANVELQRLVEEIPSQASVEIGQPVWFLLDCDEEGWLLSEERVCAVGEKGFYVPTQLCPDYDPTDINYTPYEAIGGRVFLTKDVAVAAKAAKEVRADE